MKIFPYSCLTCYNFNQKISPAYILLFQVDHSDQLFDTFQKEYDRNIYMAVYTFVFFIITTSHVHL